MTFKVLVTGSRHLTDYQAVYDALDLVYREHIPLLVIHGAARGADSFADVWAVSRDYVTPIRVPATNWAVEGPEAGISRNLQMLELHPDLVLAFFKNDAPNKGTAAMVKAAHAAGVPVIAYQELL